MVDKNSSEETRAADASDSEMRSGPTLGEPRRGFLGLAFSTSLMLGALGAAYGTLATYAVRFLFPRRDKSESWQFVGALDSLKLGESMEYESPSGAKVVVARQDDGDTEDSFVALSSICPHLGCAVHWESVNDRFFCPCHNGAFDREGKPTEGPPLAANQELTRFQLRVESGLLYIRVSSESIRVSEREA